jgi:hypothetical protein
VDDARVIHRLKAHTTDLRRLRRTLRAMTTLRSAGDLLAVVPYLLGFHPADSVVLVALQDGRVVLPVRADLPPPTEAEDLAKHLAGLVVRHGTTSAVVLGYGAGPDVTPVVAHLRRALECHGVAVLDALRVADGRFWSYLCADPSCCPPEGRPHDPAVSPIATQAVVDGYVALPSREDLARRLDPVEGADRAATAEATRRAGERLAALLANGSAAALRKAGATAVGSVLRRHRGGLRLDDDEVAWLSVLLTHQPVRDHAWESIGGDLGTHISLWTEVVRRTEPELPTGEGRSLIVAPATLLSFAAWRAGEGALASIALSRALDADPDYPMAQLMHDVLAGGLSPAEWLLAAQRLAETGSQAIRSGRV